MVNTSIVACENLFNIDCRVILWNEEGGLSFYPKKKFYPRNITLNELQKEITCFVLHHSVTYTAHSTFRGLLGRGLSVNFLIDDDINPDGVATIYQCADIKEACWSHGPMNRQGSGVEICYHPEAWENPNLYSQANVEKFGVQPHEIKEEIVFGVKRKIFIPTEAQVKACIRLMWGYCNLFPLIRKEFPKDVDGNIERHVVSDPKGLLLHEHINPQKPDPLGLPLERIEKEIKMLNELSGTKGINSKISKPFSFKNSFKSLLYRIKVAT